MNRSIQRFLTINALCLVGLSVSLAVIANFYLRHQNIKMHLDAELSLEARVISSFIMDRIEPARLPTLQKKISNIPRESSMVAPDASSYDIITKKLISTTQFQVWDLTNQTLILSTSHAPPIKLSRKTGFDDASYNTHEWRTYSIDIPHLSYRIVSMQQHDLRLGFERQLITDHLMTLFILFIFLVITFQVIIRRSLSPLIETTSELKAREPNNLDAIYLNKIPTEVQPLVIEINRLMHQLKETLERERMFAADAAHELKTPLSAMKAQIQLAMRQPEAEQKETFKKVEDSIQRYDHIIKQLLSLSRTISHSGLENFHEVDTALTAQTAIAELVPKALEQNMNIELQQNASPIILANTTLLSAALTNLIDNSIKYSKEGDTIVVVVSSHNDRACIDIIDHGPGIPGKLKQDALKRFARLYNNKAQGSGLGLSIVNEIANFLGGSLTLSDTPGGGLTISLSLPIRDTQG